MKDNEHTPAAPANVGDRGDDTLRAEVERLCNEAHAAFVDFSREYDGVRVADLRAALAVAVPVPNEEGREVSDELWRILTQGGQSATVVRQQALASLGYHRASRRSQSDQPCAECGVEENRHGSVDGCSGFLPLRPPEQAGEASTSFVGRRGGPDVAASTAAPPLAAPAVPGEDGRCCGGDWSDGVAYDHCTSCHRNVSVADPHRTCPAPAAPGSDTEGPPPGPGEYATECCASGRCEVCSPGFQW